MQMLDVLIIGAGPSGSICSTLLHTANINVLVVEKQIFPRFSIGESLLPQSMSFLENAGMIQAVDDGCFQHKNGAVFKYKKQHSEFNFEEKFSPGPGTTYQVKRADFDKRLADCAESKGVSIRYQHEVISIEKDGDNSIVTIKDEKGDDYKISTRFILDASGFGRVLPRLLDLEKQSNFPQRNSLFCHIEDNIQAVDYDREKILISIHPENTEVWYWLIPFSDGTASLGIVAKPDFFESYSGTKEDIFQQCISEEPSLKRLLNNAKFPNPVNTIKGYSADVESLYGDNFALLGNAGEFLDPVFSSGVTIAFKSAQLAADILIKKHKGNDVCWKTEYAIPLKKGVDTFKVFVEAWYDGRLQDVIFFEKTDSSVRRMICSILAGYAWDENNPYVNKTERRLNVLAEICKS